MNTRLRPNMTATLAELSTAFPGVSFTAEPARRGYRNITWTGGPHANIVRLACDRLLPMKTGFHRQPDEQELVAMRAQWDRDDAERKASEPARRAKAKADGITKRAETMAERKHLKAVLASSFPDTAFILTWRGTWCSATWSGGPSLADVQELHIGLNKYNCTRYDTPEEIASRNALRAEADRLQCEVTAEAIKNEKTRRIHEIQYHRDRAYRRKTLRDAQLSMFGQPVRIQKHRRGIRRLSANQKTWLEASARYPRAKYAAAINCVSENRQCGNLKLARILLGVMRRARTEQDPLSRIPRSSFTLLPTGVPL